MNRILIVSAEPFMRDLVRLSLDDMQAEVRCVKDVAQMHALCRRVLFDVVIVLRLSPFLNGSNPVLGLRPTSLRRPLIYVLSWQQSEQMVLSLIECGVDQYMTFPVSLHRLRKKVSDDLRNALIG
ncbi:MAG: DNA-binding response regulator [Alistipes sp.]